MSRSYTSSPPKRLRGVKWDSFGFTQKSGVMVTTNPLVFLRSLMKVNKLVLQLLRDTNNRPT